MYDLEYTLELGNKYHTEAQKCRDNNCFIASFILYGAALEAFLLAMCFTFPKKVRRTKEFDDAKGRYGRERGAFLNFRLSELISIADKLDWLPMEEMVKDISTFEYWIKWLQETRNLVHAARWLKPDPYFRDIHNLAKKATEKDYKDFLEISENAIGVVKDLLLLEVEENLAEKLGL